MNEYRPMVADTLSPAIPAEPKKRAPQSSRDQYSAQSVPFNLKLPGDLIKAIKLNAINEDVSSSEYVLACLTSGKICNKAWISTRSVA
jgi:hypothetical protein